jgi:thiol-disulfide isomerase/thioredoxin
MPAAAWKRQTPSTTCENHPRSRMMNRCASLAGAVLLAVPVAALADPEIQFLTVGDKAPAIEVAHWLRGKEIPQWEPGKVYVLEFWATWCGPCRMSMPHLTELQKEFKDYDVAIIGLSDEKLSTVVEFLLKDDWREKTQYTIATDPDRSSYNAYMPPSGNGGIPTAFIIGKDGEIEWIGHPMELDEPLEAVVKGNWDRAAFKAEWDPRMETARQRMKNEVAISRAKQAGDWAAVVRIQDETIKANPDSPNPKFSKFATILRDMNDPAAAYAYGREAVKAHWDDGMFLNRVAWFVVDDAGVKTRDLPFALEVAQRACEATRHEDASVLDTLARVYFEQGDLANAIAWQEKAVALSPSGPMADEIKATLEKYRAAGAVQ